MQFIILHGSFGKQSENWFTWLRKELEKDGHTVLASDFPIEDWNKMTKAGQGHWPIKNQNLYKWTQHFNDNIFDKLDHTKPIGLIAHSLAPLFMLNILQSKEIYLSLSIFVAPFYKEMRYEDWRVEAVNYPFHEKKFDWKEIKKHTGTPYVLYSDNDPYVKKEFSLDFADKIDASTINYKGAGHFNTDTGWTKAPLILELCRSANNS